mmetsp:Transcript_5194/g.17017  ORF Transcript_5194/g.17017 Transcript_5194/m.17017 type:complete len:206 (+) Transcript_5194:305-922(+)
MYLSSRGFTARRLFRRVITPFGGEVRPRLRLPGFPDSLRAGLRSRRRRRLRVRPRRRPVPHGRGQRERISQLRRRFDFPQRPGARRCSEPALLPPLPRRNPLRRRRILRGGRRRVQGRRRRRPLLLKRCRRRRRNGRIAEERSGAPRVARVVREEGSFPLVIIRWRPVADEFRHDDAVAAARANGGGTQEDATRVRHGRGQVVVR